ncbi:MAG: long-chain fatty acid--CoA ligase [Spirochaetia bacterium]|nr:long-chain fatty acid--CoA ligase [Spirochaetia bacterium]
MFFKDNMTVPKMIIQTAEKYPEIVAQFKRTKRGGEFEPVTYREMVQIGLDFGAALINMGIKREQPVGLISDNRAEWQQADIGIMAIGAVDVPRGCDATVNDLEKILSITECELCIVENCAQINKIVSLKEKLPAIKKLICFEKDVKENVKQAADNAGLEILYFEDVVENGKTWRIQNKNVVEKELEKGKADDLATIIFTSGTTGTPKGVMLSHQNFLAQIDDLQVRIYGNPGERAVCVLPIWHVFERIVEYVIFAQALSIVYSKPIGSILLADIKKMNPAILPAVPRIFEAVYDGITKKMRKAGDLTNDLFNFFVNVAIIQKRMTRKMFNKNPCFGRYYTVLWWFLFIIPWTLLWPLYGLGELLVFKKIKAMLGNNFRGGIAGGGAFPPKIDEFFWALGINIVEGYGMTETAPVVSVRPFANNIFGTIGYPLRGVQTRIVDQEGFILGRCKEGELQIKGPTVMKGYYKNPEKTAEAFTVDGWLHTGDLAIMTVHNELKIKGRIKDTIVLLGGENIEPLPIEMKMGESRYIKQAVVVGQDKRYLSALVLVDEDEITNYADENGISYDSLDDILASESVQKLYDTEIAELVNTKNGFKLFERINRFTLITKQFEVGVELSAKQEIMRYRISQLYEKQISEMYADKDE